MNNLENVQHMNDGRGIIIEEKELKVSDLDQYKLKCVEEYKPYFVQV